MVVSGLTKSFGTPVLYSTHHYATFYLLLRSISIPLRNSNRLTQSKTRAAHEGHAEVSPKVYMCVCVCERVYTYKYTFAVSSFSLFH